MKLVNQFVPLAYGKHQEQLQVTRLNTSLKSHNNSSKLHNTPRIDVSNKQRMCSHALIAYLDHLSLSSFTTKKPSEIRSINKEQLNARFIQVFHQYLCKLDVLSKEELSLQRVNQKTIKNNCVEVKSDICRSSTEQLKGKKQQLQQQLKVALHATMINALSDFSGEKVSDMVADQLSDMIPVIDQFFEMYSFDAPRYSLDHMAAVSAGLVSGALFGDTFDQIYEQSFLKKNIADSLIKNARKIFNEGLMPRTLSGMHTKKSMDKICRMTVNEFFQESSIAFGMFALYGIASLKMGTAHHLLAYGSHISLKNALGRWGVKQAYNSFFVGAAGGLITATDEVYQDAIAKEYLLSNKKPSIKHSVSLHKQKKQELHDELLAIQNPAFQLLTEVVNYPSIDHLSTVKADLLQKIPNDLALINTPEKVNDVVQFNKNRIQRISRTLNIAPTKEMKRVLNQNKRANVLYTNAFRAMSWGIPVIGFTALALYQAHHAYALSQVKFHDISSGINQVTGDTLFKNVDAASRYIPDWGDNSFMRPWMMKTAHWTEIAFEGLFSLGAANASKNIFMNKFKPYAFGLRTVSLPAPSLNNTSGMKVINSTSGINSKAIYSHHVGKNKLNKIDIERKYAYWYYSPCLDSEINNKNLVSNLYVGKKYLDTKLLDQLDDIKLYYFNKILERDVHLEPVYANRVLKLLLDTGMDQKDYQIYMKPSQSRIALGQQYMRYRDHICSQLSYILKRVDAINQGNIAFIPSSYVYTDHLNKVLLEQCNQTKITFIQELLASNSNLSPNVLNDVLQSIVPLNEKDFSEAIFAIQLCFLDKKGTIRQSMNKQGAHLLKNKKLLGMVDNIYQAMSFNRESLMNHLKHKIILDPSALQWVLRIPATQHVRYLQLALT